MPLINKVNHNTGGGKAIQAPPHPQIENPEKKENPQIEEPPSEQKKTSTPENLRTKAGEGGECP